MKQCFQIPDKSLSLYRNTHITNNKTRIETKIHIFMLIDLQYLQINLTNNCLPIYSNILNSVSNISTLQDLSLNTLPLIVKPLIIPGNIVNVTIYNTIDKNNTTNVKPFNI